MNEQIDIFQYMQEQEIDYIKPLAHCLKVWDKTWKFGYLEELKKESTVDMLLKTFCDTKNHYFVLSGDMYCNDEKDVYGVNIDKKEKVLSFYRCGKEPEKILAEEPIERLVEELIK